MRNVLLASLAALSAVVANAGCLLPLGCGGFEGGGNRAFERNSEMLLLCENGGFVASLETSMLEGRYVDNTGMVVGTKGEDGSIAFELSDNSDGTSTAPQLGSTAWTSVELDYVAADHSNVLCKELEARAWWSGESTVFARRNAELGGEKK
jgi:hypothetical protein